MARISVSSAKAKGRQLQKWAAEKISDTIDIPWGYEDDKDIQPRLMGQSGTDVVLRGQALEWFPFSVECKSCEAWSVPAFIRQARKNVLPGTDWLLIIKRKEFQKPVVLIDAEKFFELYGEVLNGRLG